MDKEMIEDTSDDEVSLEFRFIANYMCMRRVRREIDEPYVLSLAAVQYLFDYVTKPLNRYFLHFKNIILTVETGSYLGQLLNDSPVSEILIGNIGDGELALIKELKGLMSYKFSNCRIPLDKIESLANALSKSWAHINFNDSDITVDGLRIILRVLKKKLQESKDFYCYLQWNQSFDINQFELDELLDCVESREFTVYRNNHDDNVIQIKKFSNVESYVRINVDYEKIKTDDIKRFLNQNINKNWFVKVDEYDTECLLLMSIIDAIKGLTMSFEINCVTWKFIGQEKLNAIMEGLNETHLINLKINIPHLASSDAFETIIDKTKSMKLQGLELYYMKLFYFNFQTVVKPLKFPGLKCLCLNECSLDYKLTKELFCQLKNSKVEKFSIFHTNLSKIFDYRISASLISSNLTSLELKYCELSCKHVEMIAEFLKHTKITLLDLTGNKIKGVGIKAIANVVAQTKLNNLILDSNRPGANGVIQLLKSIQKTKITVCSVFSVYNTKKASEAVAKILKDNKILLACSIADDESDKIDEYLKRNNNSLDKAKLIINKYQKGNISYDYKYKKYFEAYELFVDTAILWANIGDKQKKIKLKLKNKIEGNYLKICGVIKDKLEVNNKNSGNERNFSDLSPETINKICSNLNLSDVKS